MKKKQYVLSFVGLFLSVGMVLASHPVRANAVEKSNKTQPTIETTTTETGTTGTATTSTTTAGSTTTETQKTATTATKDTTTATTGTETTTETKTTETKTNVQTLKLATDQLKLLESAADKKETYVVADPSIAKIQNDIVLPQKAGHTIIYLEKTDKTKEKQIDLTVTEKSTDAFDTMRQEWRSSILGDQFYDASNQGMVSIQEKQDQDLEKVWQTLDKKSDRTNLWQPEGGQLRTSDILAKQYTNLLILTKGVVNKNSRYYLNRELLSDVLSGLDWLYTNKYNMQSVPDKSDNWYHWEIGVPKSLTNIVTLLYPFLSQEAVNKYVEPLDKFIPDDNKMMGSVDPSKQIVATGANQVDISTAKLVENILRKNSEEVKKAIDPLNTVLEDVDKGEGFYKDGSFVFHTNVAYNGSYGYVLLDGLSRLLPIIQETPYKLSTDRTQVIHEWVEKGFEPFMVNGYMMDMVTGRGISRQTVQGDRSGASITTSIARLAKMATGSEKQEYQQLAKSWITANKTYYSTLSSYQDIYLSQQIENDQSIQPYSFTNLLHSFAKMDKVVYQNHQAGFAFGISLSSARIKRYEVMNSENLKGWYQGDGMVYLYNQDINQYTNDFWATVDPYKLPGTTEDVKTARESIDGGTVGGPTGKRTFIGASVLDENTGTVAMDFENERGTVTAKKSWFISQNGLIALGGGITINDQASNDVETIIENRKLEDPAAYTLYINNKKVPLTDLTGTTIKHVKSIYLQAAQANQSIGYYFMKPQNLNLLYSQRTGAWSEINIGQSTEKITKNYLTIWKQQKNQDEYNYALYPNVTKEQFHQLTKHEPKIVANTNEVQALKRKTAEGNQYNINNYVDKAYKLDKITLENAASLTAVETKQKLTLALCDPTMNNKEIHLTIKDKRRTYQPVQTKDITTEYNQKAKSWLITVAGGTDGQSRQLTLNKTK